MMDESAHNSPKPSPIFSDNEDQEPWLNPKPGYCFQEMFSFWVHVVHVASSAVIVEEYRPPCTIPNDRKLRIFGSAAEFSKAYQYGGSGPVAQKHWVHFYNDKAPIDHWQPLP